MWKPADYYFILQSFCNVMVRHAGIQAAECVCLEALLRLCMLTYADVCCRMLTHAVVS